MTTLIKNSKIYDSESAEFFYGNLLIEDGMIVSISETDTCPSADYIINTYGAMLLPGLVDIHTHGRSGFDFGYATSDEMKALASSYLKSGVTTLFPTLASETLENLIRSAKDICSLAEDSCPAFAGVHLEGRFINPAKKGAHLEELITAPSAEELKKFLSVLTLPCHISAAFELDADGSFMDVALSAGATLSLAHTCANADETKKLVKKGLSSFTHLFNAMSPLHHREGGPISIALTDDLLYAELICDKIHVSEDVIRLVYKCKGRDKLVLVTDSMSAAGSTDGDYFISGHPVIVKNGIARTLDGALAGSTLSLFDAVKNLSEVCSIPFGEALRNATIVPARLVRIDDKVGSLEIGKAADIIFATSEGGDIKISRVMKNGRFI